MIEEEEMPTMWEAFMEDYEDQYLDAWSVEFVLETFWHYCQGGKRECDAFLKGAYD